MRLYPLLVCAALAIGGYSEIANGDAAHCKPVANGQFQIHVWSGHGTDQTTPIDLPQAHDIEIVLQSAGSSTTVEMNTTRGNPDGKWERVFATNSFFRHTDWVSLRATRGAPPPYEDHIGGEILICALP